MRRLSSLSIPLNRVKTQEHSQIKGVIGVVSDFLTPPAGKVDPRRLALQFVSANRELFKVPAPALSKCAASETPLDVQPERAARSPVGYHVRLQQSYEGIPVYEGCAIVHMTKERSIYFYTSDLYPEAPAEEMDKGTAQRLSADDALEALAADLPWRGRLQGQPHCEQVYLPQEDSMRLAWCIDLSLGAQTPIADEEDRSSDWRALVDAQTGAVLQLLDVTLYARTPSWGRVFYPNPVVGLRQEDLNWDAQLPKSAYRKLRLARLDGSGFLRGPYADTADTPDRVQQVDGQFLYERGQPGFLEVMAYYHVDQVAEWVRGLGFVDLFSATAPLRINARAALGDNSKFLPKSWALQFGEGKVMDAEDASIIIHELGHAIQEAQVSDWATAKSNSPVRAMGEGFADWLATLFFAEKRRAFHATYVGDWDARGYLPPQTYLRRVDTDKTMANWQNEEHADGEIWSAVLWDLYLKLGGDSTEAATHRQARTTAAKLVLTSHLYLSDGRRDTLTYAHGLDALLTADRFIGPDPTQPGAHEQLIRDVFAKRGITA
jgi:hypothetical protein